MTTMIRHRRNFGHVHGVPPSSHLKQNHVQFFNYILFITKFSKIVHTTPLTTLLLLYDF